MPDNEQNAEAEARQLLTNTLRDIAEDRGENITATERMRAAVALANVEDAVSIGIAKRLAHIVNGGTGF